MFRVHRLAIVALAAIMIGVFGIPLNSTFGDVKAIYGTSPAMAQQAKKKKRRGLFSIIFGRKRTKQKAVVLQRNRASRSKKLRSKRSRTVAARAVAAVEKTDDAKVILVVGDFFAGGLADGLTTALAQVPALRVVDRSKGLSGFVRSDIVDWPAELPALVAETKPSYIVAMLGSNDRQQLLQGGKRLKKQTPEWFEAYGERVTRLGKSLKATKINYAWVGLPSVRFKTMNKDFLRFNEMYGKAAASRLGKFIDVWDGFSDADGNYSRSGPDVNGQIVLLRSKDGINLTRAGKRRLAYYVEGIIQKLFDGDIGNNPGFSSPGIDLGSYAARSPEYDPAKTGKTYVVRLNDPSADGGDTLAGGTVELNPGLTRNQEINPSRSAAAAAVVTDKSGRVDNFAWPPQESPSIAPIAIAAPKPETAANLQ